MSGIGSGTSIRGWSQLQSASFGGVTGLNFPSPFLDFESTKVPGSVKEIFELSAHAYMTDSNINPTIENISSYPITHLTFETEDSKDDAIKDKWEDICEDVFDIRSFNVKVGYDYHLYGNSYVSVYEPFERFLVCTNCNHSHNTKYPQTKWKWKNLDFWVNCEKCGDFHKATFYDTPIDDIEEINLIRWSPFLIDINHNPVTGKSEYWYDLPSSIRQKILSGDPLHLLEDPPEFIDAVVGAERGKGVAKIKLNRNKIFALQRPMPSMPGDSSMGMGMPLITSSLRDYFFKNIMRRAQAMVLYEHIIPFRVFSPSYVESPSTMLPLATWQKEVMTNYLKWRKNPLHIMTSPVPLNVQQIGAQGKALTLFPEIQMTDGNIIKGMNVPREFVEGGLQYSGSSVSLRMLENVLRDYVKKSEKLVNWILKKIGKIIKLKTLKASYVPFKMADDIQLKSLLVSLAQNKMVSGQFIGDIFEYDYKDQLKLISEEESLKMKYSAEAEANGQFFAQKVQEYNSIFNVPTAASNTLNPIPPEASDQMVSQLSSMDPNQAGAVMDNMSKQNPVAANSVGAKLDMSPAGANRDLMMIASMPPEQRDKAIQDIKLHDPTKYQLLKIVFPSSTSVFSPSNPPPQKNGIGGPPLKSTPTLPEQKPPRGPNATI